MKHFGQRVGALLLSAILTVGLLPTSVFATQTAAQEDGTSANPYRIATVADFAKIAEHPSAQFVLTNDITFTEAFTPIDADFTGNLDGKGYSLINLSITAQTDAALFERLSSETDVGRGVVTNIVFENPTVKGVSSAAVVAADNKGIISEISIVGGTVTATGANGVAGALAATMSDSGAEIKKIVTTAAVSGDTAGGIVGSVSGGSLINGYVGGAVSANPATDEKETYGGSIFGKSQKSGALAALSNLYYSSASTTTTVAGYDSKGAAYTNAGMISVPQSQTVTVGDTGAALLSWSAGKLNGSMSYVATDDAVLSVNAKTGAYEALTAGSTTYQITLKLGEKAQTQTVLNMTVNVQAADGEQDADSSTSQEPDASSASGAESGEQPVNSGDASSSEAPSDSASSDSTSGDTSDSSSDSASTSDSTSASDSASASDSTSASDSASNSGVDSEPTSGTDSEPTSDSGSDSTSASDTSDSTSGSDSASNSGTEEDPDVTIEAGGAWESENGVRYYVTDEGKRLTGKQVIDGASYVFDNDGAVMRYEYYYDGAWYLTDGDGAVYTNAFYSRDGITTYYSEDGGARAGWIQDPEGRTYYQNLTADEHCVLATGVTTVEGKTYLFGADGVQNTGSGWVDGVHIENGIVSTGMQTIDGKTYIIAANGVPNTGEFVYDGKTYYADADGVVYTDAFRTLDDGTIRYYGVDGQAVSGWLEHDGGRYYQNENLVLLTGRQLMTENGADHIYFFGSDGRLSTEDGWAGDYYVVNGEALTGWQTLEGSDYYFNEDGLVQKGAFVVDDAQYFGDAANNGAIVKSAVGDGTYYDADGKATPGWKANQTYYQSQELRLVTGRQTIDGTIYFFDANGTRVTGNGWAGYYYLRNGQVVTGPQTIADENGENGLYIFSSEGEVYRGEFTYGGAQYYADDFGKLYTTYFRTMEDGSLRYYNAEGKAVSGGWFDIGEDRYYQGESLTLATGKQTVGGTAYYFADTGKLIRRGWVGSYYVVDGQPVVGHQTIDGKQYVFSELGVPYKHTFIYNGAKYYASGTGELYTNCFVTSGDKRTYYDTDGAARVGWITRANGSQYYQTQEYYLLTGQQIVDGVTYFFGSDGKLSTEDGWAGDYYVVNGAALMGEQTLPDGKRYIFGTDGLVQKGDFVYNTNTYFADAKGALLCNEIRTMDNGNLRYYDETGKAPMNAWIDFDGARYYQDVEMHLVTGRQTVEGAVYFFTAQGKLKTDDGWAADYYLENGQAVTGLREIDGKTYIFDTAGKLYKGDFTYEGDVYYSDPATGVVLMNGVCTLSDGTLRFQDADGKATPGWKTLGDKTYYQTTARKLAVGRVPVDGDLYYFGADGAQITGSGWADDYYIEDGVLRTGKQEIDGKWYIFDAEGRVQKGDFQYGGDWYSADDTGALHVDTIRALSEGGRRYYDAEGAAKANTWATYGGDSYYQNAETKLVTGRVLIDGAYYFFGTDGKQKTTDGWIDGCYLKNGEVLTGRQTIDGKTYIFATSGDNLGIVYTGDFTYLGQMYRANKLGALYLNTITTNTNGTRAYVDDMGVLRTGWIDAEDGSRYHQTYTNGAYVMAAGFTAIGTDTYYFEPDGKLFMGRAAGYYNVGGKTQAYILEDGRYCVPPSITKVATGHDAAKGLYSITITSTISSAAGVHPNGSFSFDGGATWQTSNIMTVSDKVNTYLSATKIRVRDALGQVYMYTGTVSLSAISTGGNSGAGSYGIDVSMYNGVINWNAVKASGIDFAIIRATSANNYGYYVDPYYEANVRNAKAAGLDVGVYIFSYARSYQDVNDEVNYFLNCSATKNLAAAGIKFDYPVYVDYESNLNLNGTSYAQRTDFVRQMMAKLKAAGYYPGFYTYHSYMQYFNVGQLVNEGYDFWYARYPLSPNTANNPSSSVGVNVSIWQYCSDGHTNTAMKPYVNGVSGNVDQNVAYKDLPSVVHQFNGGGTQGPVTPVPVGGTLTVYDTRSQQVVTGDTADILAHIVQTEVGGFNNAEVYKAQAVAAHSWILSQSSGLPTVSLSNPGAAVKNAVAEVANQVVAYNGAVANTMYSAANGGYTQSAANMWGTDIAYLRAGIESPGDVSLASAYYNRSTNISISRMTSNMEAIFPGSTNGRTDYANWITNPEYDGYGNLTYITVMGSRIRAGRFFDGCYGMYSPNCTISFNGSGWTFVSRGNGHGVGMSQYGAAYYAQQGRDWRWILAYYFPGTSITTYGG